MTEPLDRSPVELDGLRFDERGLIPVIAQDAETGQVLMMAWANREALERTLAEGRMVYWSRSRAELWRKGDTSGHVQHWDELRVDCDADVAPRADPPGGRRLPHGRALVLLQTARHLTAARLPGPC